MAESPLVKGTCVTAANTNMLYYIILYYIILYYIILYYIILYYIILYYIILYYIILYCGPGSSVGIATDCELDDTGSNPGGDDIFLPSRPALGPTQPPVQWVPGLSRGVKCGRGVLLNPHPLLVPRSWKSRAIPLPTLWATRGL